MSRQFSLIDQFIIQVNDALSTVFTVSSHPRQNPAEGVVETPLTSDEKRNSIGCMRVNHTGEVCAQALYRGQSVLCRSDKTREMLEQSCVEETDHLAWTKSRLIELGGNTSYLNLFFYWNSFLMGLVASAVGDCWSLGFVSETETQVANHLSSHLENISTNDHKSRAIIETMREEELHHEKAAEDAGAAALPFVVKMLMQMHAKVMTTVAYWV